VYSGKSTEDHEVLRNSHKSGINTLRKQGYTFVKEEKILIGSVIIMVSLGEEQLWECHAKHYLSLLCGDI